MIRKSHISVSIFLLGLIMAPGVIAQAQTATAVAAPSRTLEGGVQKVDLSLEHLRDVGLDLKEIMTSSRHLYDEVTIQPVAMITQPSMVGPGVIINIPVGTRPVGPPQQPRKDRVDLAMNNMAPIIKLFKKNADEFVADQKELDVSDDAKAKLHPLVGDWVTGVNKISSELQQLESLTQGPQYDNAAIAAICGNMQQSARDLDKVKDKAFKIMKRERRR
ncbi:MAG TPA: hypothetical protein V6D22_13195 [Candidatus Obscuribacterales bacterium]